jgi:hypothetical protein
MATVAKINVGFLWNGRFSFVIIGMLLNNNERSMNDEYDKLKTV